MERRFSRPDETRLVRLETLSPDWLTQPLAVSWALCAARAAMISGSCCSTQLASASIVTDVLCHGRKPVFHMGRHNGVRNPLAKVYL